VHVDANELDHAIYVCDEIFGRRNQSGIITFKQASATGHKAINPGLVTVTNYILVYSANKSKWKPKRLFTGRARDKRYSSFIKGRDLPVDRWQFTTLLKGFAAAHDATDREARALLKLEPERLDDFVLANAKAVVQFATPDFDAVGEATRKAILLSKERPKEVVLVEREGHSDIFLVNGLRILFYADKLKIVDGETVAGEPLTNLWDDILSNNIHKEGGVEFPKGKKPESLLKRCLELSTSPGDLVLDSFLGSGTTAAVAMKMGRRFLGVERGEHAKSHAAVRLRSVIEGEQGGISPAVAWRGGSGFRYCILGNPLFDEFGAVTETVGFGDLAAFVFFAETGSPIPRKASAENPLLGCFGQRSVYLLWSPESAGFPNEQAGNVLTAQTLQQLPQAPPEGEHRVIYAEGCTVPRERLAQAGITFKQIPYQVIAT
jgi:adenine-specific DNA-methyltransferase